MVHRGKLQCFPLTTPSGKKIRRIGDAYVDDTVFLATHKFSKYSTEQKIYKVTHLIQEILQDFERKLYSTRGELSLKKTFYYIIMWLWKAYGTARMALTKGEGDVPTEIQRYETWEGKRTLGQYVGQDRNMEKESEVKQNTDSAWTQAMIDCHLSRLDVYWSYHHAFILKLTYTFATTTLAVADLNKLQTQMDKVYLPSVGLNRHFPHAILKGLSKYGGLQHMRLIDR